MAAEPPVKRTIAFFDGQNLFHTVKSAFGYIYPNYDVKALAQSTISAEQSRWIKMASAFPVSPVSRNRRGINSTDWIQIDRAAYDRCLDSRDYRPKP